MIEREEALVEVLVKSGGGVGRPVDGGRVEIAGAGLAPANFLAVVDQGLALKGAGQHRKGEGAASQDLKRRADVFPFVVVAGEAHAHEGRRGWIAAFAAQVGVHQGGGADALGDMDHVGRGAGLGGQQVPVVVAVKGRLVAGVVVFG